jgi:hypothetical protein
VLYLLNITKVGRVVTLTVDMTIGTGGGSTISNAPFTAGSTVATGILLLNKTLTLVEQLQQ